MVKTNTLSGWWLSHPSEKYEFVSWDYDIPNIWKVIKFMFQTTNQLYMMGCFPPFSAGASDFAGPSTVCQSLDFQRCDAPRGAEKLKCPVAMGRCSGHAWRQLPGSSLHQWPQAIIKTGGFLGISWGYDGKIHGRFMEYTSTLVNINQSQLDENVTHTSNRLAIRYTIVLMIVLLSWWRWWWWWWWWILCCTAPCLLGAYCNPSETYKTYLQI